MSQLDHRILIPKSSEVVWQYISDFANNPKWQTDCKTISFLNSKRSSAGMRWRYTTAAGREYVAEITAWYEGLGYEYTFVDGAPFRESKGRLRLQEIAEGTVVQWTFSYELGGLLGGLMNTVSARRQIESAMIDSLRLLWKELQSVSVEQPFEAKSLMRDALDYEARAQYKPRHAPAKPPAADPPAQNVPLTIAEPPVTEEDTRPRQPAKLVTDVHEPVFLSSLAATGEHAQVVSPPVEAASSLPPQSASASVTASPSSSVAEPEAPAEVKREPLENLPVMAAEQPDVAREVFEIAVPAEVRDDKSANPLSFTATKESAAQAQQPEMDAAKRITSVDTAEVSVFDLFGIPRPSQTQETQAVRVGESAAPVESSASRAALYRVGLRARLRSRRVRLRRPA